MGTNGKNTNPLEIIKAIWISSWQSLWQGEKRTLPIVLIGYGAILVLLAACMMFLGVTNQMTTPQDNIHALPLSLVNIVLILMVFLLLANFITAALITRAHAWLTHDKQLAGNAWHNAKKCFLKLFAIHVTVLAIDFTLEFMLTKLTMGLPDSVKMLVAIISFIIYLIVLALPFMMYTGIVIEGLSFGKAISQGFKLLKSAWAITISILTLGLLLPLTVVMGLVQIPYFNFIVALFLIFAFYPFVLVLLAFSNIFIYQEAKKKYHDKLLASGLDITQA